MKFGKITESKRTLTWDKWTETVLTSTTQRKSKPYLYIGIPKYIEYSRKSAAFILHFKCWLSELETQFCSNSLLVLNYKRISACFRCPTIRPVFLSFLYLLNRTRRQYKNRLSYDCSKVNFSCHDISKYAFQ